MTVQSNVGRKIIRIFENVSTWRGVPIQQPVLTVISENKVWVYLSNGERVRRRHIGRGTIWSRNAFTHYVNGRLEWVKETPAVSEVAR